MTITVEFAGDKRRWSKSMYFEADKNDAGNIVFDYSGELGSDTVSTAAATVENLTAGTPSISSNVVTTALSGLSEGEIAKFELKMTSAANRVIDRTVYIRVVDY